MISFIRACCWALVLEHTKGHTSDPRIDFLKLFRRRAILFGGHAGDAPDFEIGSNYDDLKALSICLRKIMQGNGDYAMFPFIYRANKSMNVLMPLRVEYEVVGGCNSVIDSKIINFSLPDVDNFLFGSTFREMDDLTRP